MRKRNLRERVLAIFGLIASAALAWILATLWPIATIQTNADFHLGLASAVITVLGIVLAVVVVAAQLGSAAGRSNASSVISGGSWLYLSSFVVAAFSNFAIASYSIEATASPICLSALYIDRE